MSIRQVISFIHSRPEASPCAAENLPVSLLETLEPRIAPATITVGQVGVITGQGYDDGPNPQGLGFALAHTAPIQAGDPAIFSALDTESYYIDLKAGDTMRMLSSGGTFDFIKVSSGRAFVFFFDANDDGIVQPGELSGIVLSSKANITINGSVDGDILATLDSKLGTFSTDDLISNKQDISGITVTGGINGSIIAGGNIANIKIGQSVEGILSGTPTGVFAYSVGGTGSGTGDGSIAVFSPGLKASGGNITNVTVGSLDILAAGPGGEGGGKGGNVTNVTITGDDNGFGIFAGDGGNGVGKTNAGGAGGTVNQVVVFGLPDSTPNDLILIGGGNGGDGSDNKSKGGAGGNVTNVFVGYETSGAKVKTIVPSVAALLDNVTVFGGDGGKGFNPGNGGSLTNINIISAPPDVVPATPEIELLGGNGGDFFDVLGGGKAGVGGSISKFDIQNVEFDPLAPSSVLVIAGDATAAGEPVPLLGKGSAGGSISNGKFLGFVADFFAGDGSSVASGGGNGGSVSNITIDFQDVIVAKSLSFHAGIGGDAITGKGGNGGNVTLISAPLTDLSSFEINSAGGGDGGASTSGIGGNGGHVTKVNVFDFDFALVPDIVDVFVGAGDGGKGGKAGGNGGFVDSFFFFSSFASLELYGGEGGDGTGAVAKGGLGGDVKMVAFTSDENNPLTEVSISAGDGGDSTGKAAAGRGGSVISTNVQTFGNVEIFAGLGGDAEDGAAVGAGGNIGSTKAAVGLVAISQGGSVAVLAGDAGLEKLGFNPTKGAAGGSVINLRAQALSDVLIQAGDGSFGGAGGDVNRLGIQGTLLDNPLGDVQVLAGRGGDAATATGAAGRGGNLASINGYTSANPLATVQFFAGDGGDGGGKGGLGGSISLLTINPGGGADFSVVAGHGGEGNKGANGGSVSQVSIASDVVVRAVAAGNGGDSFNGKGANGGSVTKVDVAGDIGYRTGSPYGFDANSDAKMGGIFAGARGINLADPTNSKFFGTSGNVTFVTATAIAAIVADRDAASPSLVNLVDRIFLNGNTAALADTAGPTGKFVNFGSANIVGAKSSDPNDPGSVSFEYEDGGSQFFDPSGTSYAWDPSTQSPIDGLIAAQTLTANRNFTPLAFLTNIAAKVTDPPDYRLFVPTLPTV